MLINGNSLLSEVFSEVVFNKYPGNCQEMFKTFETCGSRWEKKIILIDYLRANFESTSFTLQSCHFKIISGLKIKMSFKKKKKERKIQQKREKCCRVFDGEIFSFVCALRADSLFVTP